MTILKNDPCAVLDALVNEIDRNRSLTLAEGEREQSVGTESLIVGEFQK